MLAKRADQHMRRSRGTEARSISWLMDGTLNYRHCSMPEKEEAVEEIRGPVAGVTLVASLSARHRQVCLARWQLRRRSLRVAAFMD
jgi:hypothetical protein